MTFSFSTVIVLFSLSVAFSALSRPFAALEAQTHVEDGSWTTCGRELGGQIALQDQDPGFCRIRNPPADKFYLVRYGAGANWRYNIVSGSQWFTGEYLRVPCASWYFGTSGVSAGMSICAYRPLDLTHPSTRQQLQWPAEFRPRADVSEPFSVSTNCPSGIRWARYLSNNNTFWYKLVKGKAECLGKNWFGAESQIGIEDGVRCETGTTCVNFGNASSCATQGHICEFGATGDNAFQIVSYEGDGFGTVELMTRTSIPCTTRDIGTEPKKSAFKSCSLYKPDIFFERTGYWQLAMRGPEATMSLEEGYKRELSSTVGQEWSKTLSAGFEAGFEFGGASAKVTVTGEISNTERQEIARTAGFSGKRTCTAKCPESHPNLYQWKLSANEICDIGDASCRVDIGTCFYSCSATMDPPKCPFSNCCNGICTVCKNAEGVCPR